MMGFGHVLRAQLISGFIQNLAAIKVDVDLLAIGMVDILFGNDSEFTNSSCFAGDGAGRINIVDTGKVVNGILKASFDYSTTGVGFDTLIFCADTGVADQRFFQIRQGASPNEVSMVVIKWPFTILSSAAISIASNTAYHFEATFNTVTGFCDLSNGVDTVSVDFSSSLGWTETLRISFNSRQSAGIERLDDGNVCNCRVSDDDGDISWWPLPSPIVAVATDTVYDVVGGNHSSYDTGTSLANNGFQDIFHYLQTHGGKWDGINKIVPGKADDSGPADGIGVNNYVQTGNLWLGLGGTKMKNADVAKLKTADAQNVWFDGVGNAKQVTFAELEASITNFPNTYGGDVISGESIKNITLK